MEKRRFQCCIPAVIAGSIPAFYADGVKGSQNSIDIQLLFFLIGGIDDRAPFVHHQQPVAIVNGISEVMSHHQCRDFFLLHQAPGQLHHDLRCRGIKS